MADIFISYARADRARVETLAAMLEADGYSVWWDRHIESGAEFSADIERELEAAGAVIVCWSAEGVKSRWVKDEATIAARGDKLKTISLDGTEPPIGYMQYHAVDFSNWNGKADAPAYAELLRAIKTKVNGDAAPNDLSRPAAPTAPKPSGGFSWTDPKILAGAGLGLLALVLVAVLALRGGSGAVDAPATMSGADDAAPIGVADNAEIETPENATSIAVLPFADLSPQGDQQYFSDGISEEILNVLARVDGLKVASRTSAFGFRGEDKTVMEIASALGVRYVVEGSVRKAGDQIRVTAQLIDGESDAHLWSQTYDDTLTVDNIFDIQDGISKSIVEQIGEGMGLGRTNAVKFAAAAGTDDLRAYDAFLEGREMFLARDDHDPNAILAKFEEATRLDSEFARGWSALAAAYAAQESWRNTGRDYNSLAIEAAETALKLDADLAMPHAVIGMTAKLADGRPDKVEAIDQLNRAIELDPNDPVLWSWRGQHLTELGFFDAAVSDLKNALAINEEDLISRTWRVKANMYAGRRDEELSNVSESSPANMFYKLHQMLAGPAFGDANERFQVFVDAVDKAPLRAKFSENELAALLAIFTDPAADRDEEFRRFRDAIVATGAPEERVYRPMWLYAFKRFEDLKNLPDLFGDAVWWLRAHDEYMQSPERYRLMHEQGLPDFWREKGFPPQCRAIDPLSDGRDYECD